MKVGKPISKRTPVRLRHKIQKASAAKQKKARKEEKKNPQWRSRLKKDPGIPNLFPYKAKVLAEIEESKRRKEEELQKKREIAKAQRQGKVLQDTATPADDDDDEELMDHTGHSDDDEDDDEMEVQDESNPMAALLASAQARAQAYQPSDAADNGATEGVESAAGRRGTQGQTTTKVGATGKALPKQALEDPVKAVTKVMEQMQNTPDGVQRLMDQYAIPALVTSGTDFTTRYLVEVARKRGRLGRGGIPNLHAAALTVLGDLNEGRLTLPSVEVKKTTVVAAATAGSKSEVQIVQSMAKPFKLEGLWGDDDDETTGDDAMAV